MGQKIDPGQFRSIPNNRFFIILTRLKKFDPGQTFIRVITFIITCQPGQHQHEKFDLTFLVHDQYIGHDQNTSCLNLFYYLKKINEIEIELKELYNERNEKKEEELKKLKDYESLLENYDNKVY
jgi:hypothetical protein